MDVHVLVCSEIHVLSHPQVLPASSRPRQVACEWGVQDPATTNVRT